MEKTMKAGVITEPYKFEIQEMPVRLPGPGEVLIRQRAVALCTMEQRVYTGARKFPYPGCWGHEISGIVEEIGPDTATDLQVGDHVALGIHHFCGQCELCRKGLEEHCLHRGGLVKINGVVGIFGMAQYNTVAARRLAKIDKEIPFEHSALTEPLACVIQGLRKLNVRPAETVAVIGAGTMGLLNLMAAVASGAKVIVSEIDEKRRAKALELGAAAVINPAKEDVEEKIKEYNNGFKADAVIIAIGNKNANDDALKMVAIEGRILYFASARPVEPLDIDPNIIHDTGIVLTGVKGKNIRDIRDAAFMISSGIVDVAAVVEGTVDLENAQQGLENASKNSTYRIVVMM